MQIISDQNGNGNLTNKASNVERPLEVSPANGGDGDDGDDGPPTGRTSPEPRSRPAIRDDGAILMSLEDAGDRDLTGRQVASFLMLSAEESAKLEAAIARSDGEIERGELVPFDVALDDLDRILAGA